MEKIFVSRKFELDRRQVWWTEVKTADMYTYRGQLRQRTRASQIDSWK